LSLYGSLIALFFRGGDDMELKEAMGLAAEFPEWVDHSIKRSARRIVSNIYWFIQTLYEKGYEIRKKGDKN